MYRNKFTTPTSTKILNENRAGLKLLIKT